MTTIEMALLLLLAATWAALLWVYRRLTGEIDDLARERVEHTELQSNIAQMVAQLQQAADELGEALAARTGKLQELLAQADRRIAEYATREALAAAERSWLAPGNASRFPAQPVQETHGADGTVLERGSSAAAAGYSEVRRLAEQGLDPVTIAQRTNRGREEVRLLLQLGQLTHSEGPAEPTVLAEREHAKETTTP
jgi:hypothetical protein